MTNIQKQLIGYLFQEKRVGLRHRKKQVKLWWILDPETRALYSYAEKDEVKLIDTLEFDNLSISDKQNPTRDKRGRYQLQLQYTTNGKPEPVFLFTPSQRLWVDWLSIFSKVLNESKT